MAAALTVGSGQINNLFGIQSKSNEFLKSWINFFSHIQETRRNDAILGWCTLIFLLFMRVSLDLCFHMYISFCPTLLQKLKDVKCGLHLLNRYLSLCRNVVAVFIGILLCYLLSRGENEMPFRINGEITPGLPPLRLPAFSTIDESGKYLNFGGMASQLGGALASIPLLSILESVAIAKAFCAYKLTNLLQIILYIIYVSITAKGKIVDASQEMIALGLCNFFTSFFPAMPITGSFARSAVNNASGVQSQLGGAFTGILILMTLAFLTPTFAYIPKATLAAIIISAMIFMVEYDRIGEIWRAKSKLRDGG